MRTNSHLWGVVGAATVAVLTLVGPQAAAQDRVVAAVDFTPISDQTTAMATAVSNYDVTPEFSLGSSDVPAEAKDLWAQAKAIIAPDLIANAIINEKNGSGLGTMALENRSYLDGEVYDFVVRQAQDWWLFALEVRDAAGNRLLRVSAVSRGGKQILAVDNQDYDLLWLQNAEGFALVALLANTEEKKQTIGDVFPPDWVNRIGPGSVYVDGNEYDAIGVVDLGVGISSNSTTGWGDVADATGTDIQRTADRALAILATTAIR